MGVKTDSNAVLDAAARVYGVTGLRVADASTSPLLGPGHPIATVCTYHFWYNENGMFCRLLIPHTVDMIAEKVASFILNHTEAEIDEAKAGGQRHFEL